MELKKLTEDRYEEWNSFVNHSEQGSIFSKTWYLDSLQQAYEILVVEDTEMIKAGIVLIKNEIKTYSNPMLDKYLGVLLLKESGNRQKIVSKQYKYMELLSSKLKKIKSFDYYFHPSFTNWIPFYWNGFAQQTRYTYRISNIDRTINEIKSEFHGNIKNNIKNAIKSGVVIRQDAKFEDLWDLVNKTFIRQGGASPFKRERLNYFIDTLQKRGAFVSFGAYDKSGRCIAVCGLVYDDKSSYLLLNGICRDNNIRGANDYMLSHTIEYFHNRCKYYDFEGSILVGVEPFYRRFGGELTPYMKIWNDNFFNYAKIKAKKIYKKVRYGK